jgi:hypothetical protein
VRPSGNAGIGARCRPSGGDVYFGHPATGYAANLPQESVVETARTVVPVIGPVTARAGGRPSAPGMSVALRKSFTDRRFHPAGEI